MSLTQLTRTRSRRIAAGLVAGVTLTLAIVAPANAALVRPPGSRATVFVETGDITFDPANAITSGWWGHEGGANDGTGTGSTFLSMDGSDGAGNVTTASINAMLAAMGTDDTSKIGFAIVPTSADGSAEAPTVTAGQNAAQVFHWILNSGLGGGLNGTMNPNDSVTTVSTLSQITAWVTAHEPVQQYDSSLVLHDVAPGSPVSLTPQGSSILNTWPAGTALSLVAYVTNGNDSTLDNKVPLVAVGADGKAETAWMPFVTVAKPGDAVRTSAGYAVVGPYAPTVSLSKAYGSTSTTLTATLKKKNGTVATDATGTMNFAQVVGGTDQTATQVPVSNGVATLTLSSAAFPPGSFATYDTWYVPDTAGSASYLATATQGNRTSLQNPSATHTTLAISGGSTDTFTATVSPAVAGKVVFKNGSTVMGTVTVASGKAKLVKALTAGKHVITAAFTPTSTATYRSSSASKTVWQPTITTRWSVSRIVHGTRPRLTVRVVATGATVSGRVQFVYRNASGVTRTYTVTLSGGAASLRLPAVPRGVGRITLKYLGNSQVLAANKAITFRAY